MRALPAWFLAVMLLPACGGSEEPTNSETGKESSGSGSEERPDEVPGIDWVAEADKKFNASCAICHGKDGKGEVPAVANYPVKPKDLTDPEWQASVDDDYLRKIIVEGGASVGKSALMTGAPDLKDKPELLEAIVAKVRGLSAES